ncbi:hypothetical protein H2200_010490 [Cladophialophora chaetospira]|uniref:Uncharacterized protein n=1 Tax=Cladophialophora chaetospira TaxID=386627 RepID=A0AA38X1J9_9EURO|nr:hypothetical protein H2200_010490 [Cladophialophora chaetospira]
MSTSGDPPEDHVSPPDGRRNSAGRQPSNIIEFVDSQDPNVRSAIQRHTAYHSAAQRREARSRLLRRSSQTRYLDWTRRPRTDTDIATSSASSASSVSISPAPTSVERSEQPTRATSAERGGGLNTDQAGAEATAETTSFQAGISRDDEVLNFHQFESTVAYMMENDTSRYLLLAYAYAMRRSRLGADENSQDQVNAQTNFGRGTNILWNRLRMPGHASSDANVQAVLLLLAYTADFGQADEVRLHADALRTMVDQRGGVAAFATNPALLHQLLGIEESRRFHLTLNCEIDCPDPLRFPNGLGLRPGGNEE